MLLALDRKGFVYIVKIRDPMSGIGEEFHIFDFVNMRAILYNCHVKQHYFM